MSKRLDPASATQDSQYVSKLRQEASGDKKYISNFANVMLGEIDKYNASQARAQASTQATSTNTAPATEDMSVRRDNFRKSLFKTPSGGDMNASSVRRKSLLGE